MMTYCELIRLIEDKEKMIQDTRGDTQDRHYKDLVKLNSELEDKIRKNDSN
jgi:hypothetical protein